MKTYRFKALIKKHPGIDGAYIEFPYNVETEFGSKGQVKVLATFDGVAYRGSLVKMGGDCHWIGITQAIRKQIAKNPGDTVEVNITKDDAVRTIEIPEDFKTLLQKNTEILNFFNKLSYTHQREYVNWINDAKKEETRVRRMEKTIEMLREKELGK